MKYVLITDSASNHIAVFSHLTIPVLNVIFKLMMMNHFAYHMTPIKFKLVIKDGLKDSNFVLSSLEKISKIAKLAHSSTAVIERHESILLCVPNANKTR